MATEEQKKANQLRLANLTLLGLSTAVWDMVGDSALVFSKGIGESILPVLEKEMGLEIAGQSPEEIGNEIGRILVDEFGFAESVEISFEGDVAIQKVKNCLIYNLCKDLTDAGVETPFFCTFKCLADAIVARMGGKVRVNIERGDDRTSIITLERV